MKLTLLLLIPVSLACAPRVPPPPQAQRTDLTASDSIRLAVLAHLSAGARRDLVVCVAVAPYNAGAEANRDPTPTFMSALAARLPHTQLRPYSGCRRQTQPRAHQEAVTDAATGAAAIDRWVGRIEWEDSTRALVKAGYWCGVLCAAGYRCDLERDSQGWAVVRCITEWISARPRQSSEIVRGVA